MLAIALAAIIVTSPAACPAGTWATPAGEAGYSCAATAPRSETWWLPTPPRPAAHPAPKHHVAPKHRPAPKHHAAPKHRHH